MQSSHSLGLLGVVASCACKESGPYAQSETSNPVKKAPSNNHRQTITAKGANDTPSKRQASDKSFKLRFALF